MNSRGEIKIADFGLARYVLPHITKLTKKVVTYWYRAPEIFFGDRNYNYKVDMWAVGYDWYHYQVYIWRDSDKEAIL